MMQLPRWKQNDGADFIFYDPHPGFVSGQAEHAFYKMTCNDFKHATHILVERPQRNTCQVGSPFMSPEHMPCLRIQVLPYDGFVNLVLHHHEVSKTGESFILESLTDWPQNI